MNVPLHVMKMALSAHAHMTSSSLPFGCDVRYRKRFHRSRPRQHIIVVENGSKERERERKTGKAIR